MSDKVAYGTLAGAIVALVVWAVAQFWKVEIPANVQAALEMVLLSLPVGVGAVVAWWKAERHPSESARDTIVKELNRREAPPGSVLPERTE